MSGAVAGLRQLARKKPEQSRNSLAVGPRTSTCPSPLAWLFNAVVRGKRNARAHIYRYSIATVVISTCVALACIILSKNVSIGLAAAGLALNAIAMRLIAGQGYAMISAMFRAQRAYADLGKQE
jgi:hypothetical protein